MARIELRYNTKKIFPLVLVDDKIITLKKEKNGLYFFEVPSEKEINLKIVSYNELIGEHWFGRFLLFYIIGLFGLFSPKYNKCPYLLNYEANVQVNQDVTIFINDFKEKALGFSNHYDQFDNETNRFVEEKKIKRRMNMVRFFKFLTIVIYALTIFILFLQNE